jgi:serine/threonine protein kinase
MRIESQHLGQYELRRRLHQSAAGETWLAYNKAAQRMVILKFYRTEMLDTADALTEYLQRLEKLASLHHPHIVQIYDIQVLASRYTGEPSPMICLAIEYIEGETLADYIRSTSAVGKMPPSSEIVQLFSSLAIAIDSAHQHGVAHGNLKPTNILLAPGAESRVGTPMLTDFAASKLLPKKYGSDIPFYLAPEQIQGASADARSDCYALGVLLYELYTGMPPFRGNRPIAVMMQHVNALPTSPDLVNPSVSPALTQLILRCLSKDPGERFPNAISLAIALANALHVPVPESLRRAALLLNMTFHEEPQAAQLPAVKRPQSAAPPIAPPSWPKQGLDGAAFSPLLRRAKPSLVVMTVLALALIISAGLGATLLAQQNGAVSTRGTGHAFFLNSGQLNEHTTQGINDELQVDLANLPAPGAGKSYYAWLLGDVSQSEALPLLLGRLTIEQGNVHFLYTGNQQHTNLLASSSRFLVTEDDAHTPSSNPLLDQSTWRYYAVIPQTPDPADALHFSMLDHLRHLLVESPELAIRGLHGGLAFWFARDTATVADLSRALPEDWQNKDPGALHDQVIRILDYLDGSSFVKSDLPPATPWLADSPMAQVPLLGPAPQDADPPGYVYQNEAPPGYAYLVQTHLNGAILAPQATAAQHRLAVQINGGIDNARRALTRVYQDAKRLLPMTDAQLLKTSSLAILDDMATQAQYAYTGQPDPSTGISQGGALWIYDNLQRLATFEVAPYTAPKS